MSIFDQAYDEMTLGEVCVRLPSELAISALKRRVNDLTSLLDFIGAVGSHPSDVKEIRTHINNLLNKYSTTDILDVFNQEMHPALFNWLDDNNKNRIKTDGKDKLTRKFKFNLSKGDDVDVLTEVLKDILAESNPAPHQVLAVLEKADQNVFNNLLDFVIKDSRPDVRQCLLGLSSANRDLVTDHQLTIALKALPKASSPIGHIGGLLDFKLFSALKASERLSALQLYFNFFPKYRGLKVFSTEPSQEEFELILFAGCIEQNELVTNLSNLYKDITENEPPSEEEQEETP